MIYEFINAHGVKRPVEVDRKLSDEEESQLADYISRSSVRCGELYVNKAKFIWQGKNHYRELDIRGLTFEEELFFLRSVHVDTSKKEIFDARGLVYRIEAPVTPPVPEVEANDNLLLAITAEQRRFNRMFAGKGV